jgi:uncharacterized membrane protein YbhN (UPF0104 family)
VTSTPDNRTTQRHRLKTALKVGVTLALCGMLYVAADWRAVARQLAELDGRLLVAALALFVPQTIVSAWRWSRLIAPWGKLSLTNATAHTLIGSAWNLIVPSKLGDFSKAALVPLTEPAARKNLAVCVGVEKVADLAALALATLIGVQLDAPSAAVVLAVTLAVIYLLQRALQSRGLPLALVACTIGTGLLWSLHLTQIHLFLLSAGVNVSPAGSLARVPTALLAGILPAAFCGIGTRDAALVWLFADVAPPATMAAVGLLTALRYVVPGAAGIPLLWVRRRSAAANRRVDRFANRRRSAPAVAS